VALEGEKSRLRSLAKSFSELRAGAEKLSETRPFLLPFADCVRRIDECFGSQLEARLKLVDAVSPIEPGSASAQVLNIESPAGRLLRMLSSCLQSVPATPEELVHFTAACFTRLGMSEYRFIITMADSAHVSMLTLREVASQLGFTNSLADFGALFNDDPCVSQIVVLFLPERMLKRSNSLDWTVIAHEVGHAYLEKSDVVGKRFPKLRHLNRQALKWMIDRDKFDDAIRFAYFVEYACDEIAVRITGPIYPWRLFVGFFSLGQLHSEGAHPPMDLRLRRALVTATRLGFAETAAEIERLFDIEMQHVTARAKSPLLPTESELDALSADINNEVKSVTLDELVDHCESHYPPIDIEGAMAQLGQGRPLALPGWAVLCLATPNEKISASALNQEAVADSIRLGQINPQLPALPSAANPA
jgi:hypothetical protein